MNDGYVNSHGAMHSRRKWLCVEPGFSYIAALVAQLCISVHTPFYSVHKPIKPYPFLYYFIFDARAPQARALQCMLLCHVIFCFFLLCSSSGPLTQPDALTYSMYT